MRTLPADLEERDLLAALAEGWGLQTASARYLAVGGGSYHWVVTGADGGRHFITVDDLDRKGFLGHTRDSAFEGLRSAFDTALALRRQGGLEFVVAPRLAHQRETVRRIGSRYSVAVFPFVEATTRRFDEDPPPRERDDLVEALVRLHQATPVTQSVARPFRVRLAEREGLESALRDLDQEWPGGPFSEPARALLARHAEGVLALLKAFDDLAGRLEAAEATPVVTHGEPHPGNVLRAGGRQFLIDWDTVGLAQPERDLWMVDSGSGEELRTYERVSGRRIDRAAIALYRMRWGLDDISSFLTRLRSAHDRTTDTEHAWDSLSRTLQSADRRSFGPGASGP